MFLIRASNHYLSVQYKGVRFAHIALDVFLILGGLLFHQNIENN